MSLPKPNLDNKSFQEFVEEARKLIPIYAPDWTDQNVSDPGITLIELFAWLTEMQIYHLDKVTEKNKLKFLKLLGIKPMPAKPAKADVTFSISDENSFKLNECKLAAKNVETGNNIIFEIDSPLNVVPNKLEMIKTRNNQGVIDNTNANELDGHYYYAFGENAELGSVIYLGFDKRFNEANLMIYWYDEDLTQQATDNDEKYDVIYSVEVKWEYLNEDKWMDLIADPKTPPFTFNGMISLTIPTDPGENQDYLSSEEKKFLDINDFTETPKFWIRCKIEKEGYDIPPRLDSIKLNTVSATQKETIKNEIIGSSNGMPNQIFSLKQKPVIDENLKLVIEDESWTEVDDFDTSAPNILLYVVDYDNGEILFGNGIYGLIPPEGKDIEVTYYSGGGDIGNVRAGEINQIISFDSEISSNFLTVKNEIAASGGTGKETLEEAVIRARKDIKTPYQAVTSEDYEYLAKATPGLKVGRAKAIPDAQKNSVTVLVVPESTLNEPEPSKGFLDTVSNYLDKHRLITTKVNVEEPGYVEVSIGVSIKIKPGYSAQNVNERALDTLNTFINPLNGGPEGDGWPFGRNIFKSEIYELLHDVNGVDCISGLTMAAEGYNYDGEKIEIHENDLACSKDHYIRIIGPEEECMMERYS